MTTGQDNTRPSTRTSLWPLTDDVVHWLEQGESCSRGRTRQRCFWPGRWVARARAEWILVGDQRHQ
jgi:hypothetical protein